MKGTIEPGVLARLVWRRKWRILLGGFVCSMLALVAASGLPVRYSASGLLIAEAAAPKTGEPRDRLTQSDILRSPTLLNSTADQLDLVHRPQFIPRLRYSPILVRAGTAIEAGWRALTAMLKPEPTVASPALDHADAVARYLQSHLKVGGNENSRVLTIGFEAGTPELAAAVVNTLMQQFVAHDLAARHEVAENSYQQLMQRAAALRQEAAAADLRVQQFQKQHNVLTLQAGAPSALLLNAQQADLAAAVLNLGQAQAALDASRQGTTHAVSSPALQLLSERETDVLQRIARAGEGGSRNPNRLALDDELRAVRAQIDIEGRRVAASLARDVDIAQRRVTALRDSVEVSQGNANDAGNAQLELSQISRDAEAKRSLYQALLARAEDARVAATQLPSAQVVSPAVPPLEREPSPAPMMALLGFVGGMLLTMVVVWVRNLLWAKIASAKGLADATGMPGLGSLPHLRSLAHFRGSRSLSMPDLAMIEGRSPIAETLRGMRLAMQNMAAPDTTPLNTGTLVLITSAEAGEGKTTVAAALARRAAGDGLRVLLIEADLRRPRLSQVLGLGSSPNLENALLERAGFDEMIQIDRQSGLHCIVALGNHPNPVSLLASERFDALMAHARKSYDLVVFDSPPVLRVSDSIVLSRWADIIVFAVRAENTAQALIIEALSRFPEQLQSRVVTLLTRAPISRYDRQGYFSGYGDRRPTATNQVIPATRPRTDVPAGSFAEPVSKIR